MSKKYKIKVNSIERSDINKYLKGKDIPFVFEDADQVKYRLRYSKLVKNFAFSFKKIKRILVDLLNSRVTDLNELKKLFLIFSNYNIIAKLPDDSFFSILEDIGSSSNYLSFLRRIKNYDLLDKNYMQNYTSFVADYERGNLHQNTLFINNLRHFLTRAYSMYRPLVISKTKIVDFNRKYLFLLKKYGSLAELFLQDVLTLREGEKIDLNQFMRIFESFAYDINLSEKEQKLKDNLLKRFGGNYDFLVYLHYKLQAFFRKSIVYKYRGKVKRKYVGEKISKKSKNNFTFSDFNKVYEHFFVHNNIFERQIVEYCKKRYNVNHVQSGKLIYFDVDRFANENHNLNNYKTPDFVIVLTTPTEKILIPVDFKVNFGLKGLDSRYQISAANLYFAFFMNPNLHSKLNINNHKLKILDGFFLGFDEFNPDKDLFVLNNKTSVTFKEIVPNFYGKLVKLYKDVAGVEPDTPMQLNAFLYLLYKVMDENDFLPAEAENKKELINKKNYIFASRLSNFVFFDIFKFNLNSKRNVDLLKILKEMFIRYLEGEK